MSEPKPCKRCGKMPVMMVYGNERGRKDRGCWSLWCGSATCSHEVLGRTEARCVARWNEAQTADFVDLGDFWDREYYNP